MLDQVFELFAQVDPSFHRTQGGLGIGLTVAKRLIEIHGGHIEARSEGEGQGSEFIVRLPERARTQPMSADTPPAATTHVPRRVLIADDNVDAAESLSMLLHSMGHETYVVHDGLAAIEAGNQLRPDVVILDIGMPKLDGYEAARRIAAQPWSKTTLLVALTGWGKESDQERATRAGFHRHLLKPVDLELLAKLLAEDVRS
jgi:CheY-like chemotaxis protein